MFQACAARCWAEGRTKSVVSNANGCASVLGPHHGREVHGLCDGADAVVNAAVRWTEVQWHGANRALDNLPGPAQMSDDAFVGEPDHRA